MTDRDVYLRSSGYPFCWSTLTRSTRSRKNQKDIQIARVKKPIAIRSRTVGDSCASLDTATIAKPVLAIRNPIKIRRERLKRSCALHSWQDHRAQVHDRSQSLVYGTEVLQLGQRRRWLRDSIVGVVTDHFAAITTSTVLPRIRRSIFRHAAQAEPCIPQHHPDPASTQHLPSHHACQYS